MSLLWRRPVLGFSVADLTFLFSPLCYLLTWVCDQNEIGRGMIFLFNEQSAKQILQFLSSIQCDQSTMGDCSKFDLVQVNCLPNHDDVVDPVLWAYWTSTGKTIYSCHDEDDRWSSLLSCIALDVTAASTATTKDTCVIYRQNHAGYFRTFVIVWMMSRRLV